MIGLPKFSTELTGPITTTILNLLNIYIYKQQKEHMFYEIHHQPISIYKPIK